MAADPETGVAETRLMLQRFVAGVDRQNLPTAAGDQAEQAMFRDIDSMLARLESGITAERTAMAELLARLMNQSA